MKTRDLKSLSNTIASVVDPLDKERAQMLQEGFLNSLTEKARQIVSKDMEDDEEEGEDEDENEMEDSEEKPSKKKKSKISEEIELAEKAAPGYEDWASDPKVKASFKKQYGKRWKEVMYGHSWNLAKQEKKVGLDEGWPDYDKVMPPALQNGVKTFDKAKGTRSGVLVKRPYFRGPSKFLKGRKPKSETDYKYSTMNEEDQLDELTDTLLFRARAKAKGLGKFKVRKTGIAGTEKDRPLANKITDELRRRGAIKEETIGEGFQAKRMRVIRKEIGKSEPTTGKTKEFLEKTYKRKLARNKALAAKYPERSAKYGGGQQGNMLLRAALRKKAMDAKGLSTKGLSEETLGEGFEAKRQRVINKEINKVYKNMPVSKNKTDFLSTAHKKKAARDAAIKAKYSGDDADQIRRTLKRKAMIKKGIFKERPKVGNVDLRRKDKYKDSGYHVNLRRDQNTGDYIGAFSEAVQAKLNRAKGKAYRLGYSGNTNAHAKAMRLAAELEDKMAAMQARRGGASPEAVQAAGNIAGKRGFPTKKGMKLAGERRRGQTLFRARARDAEQRGRNATPSQKAEKRKFQKGMAAFRNAARSGDFGQDNQAMLRARSNFEKKYGRLKNK